MRRIRRELLCRDARIVWVAIVVSLALLPAAGFGQSLSAPKAITAAQADVSPAKVTPGGSFTITAKLTVGPGLHLQAHKPRQDYLIGTELAAPAVEGISWQEPQYPPAHERAGLLEYSGQIDIQLAGKVDSDARPGPHEIPLSLRYQACSDQGTCYSPTTIQIPAVIEILPGQGGNAEGRALSDGSKDKIQVPKHRQMEAAAGPVPSKASVQKGAELAWEPFNSQRLAALTAGGKTVLIDFTADWCPNCKLNEYWALNTKAVGELVRRNGVVPLVADFTREDPTVRAWLSKFGSISVPLTVIVPGSRPTQPIVLRDTYRQGTLLAALEQAGPSVPPGSVRQAGLTLDTPVKIDQPVHSIWGYLLAGLVGGFILNFMPCVLPVISIKILSLVGQAGQSRRRVLGLGLSFAGGMVFLFLVLGGMVALAGQTWGALFQSTTFLLVMLGVLVAMTASLFGAFTMGVPAKVGDVDAAIEGEGYAGSFGKGMLAVLLGTPCSGPFLGSVLAWAAGRAGAGQAYLSMLVFLSMGVGMALPFVVLAAKPGWMRFIPRPGAWMETFKQLMGFLLLLTVVYILSILEAGLVKWAVLFAFGVALASWLYGRLVRPGRSAGANWTGRLIAALIVAAFAWVSFGGWQAAHQVNSNSIVEGTGAVVE